LKRSPKKYFFGKNFSPKQWSGSSKGNLTWSTCSFWSYFSREC